MERPQIRKYGVKFKLGLPLPIPRTLARGRVGKDVKLEVAPGNEQHGVVVELPPRGGAFTRALVGLAGKWRPSAKRQRWEAAEADVELARAEQGDP